MDNEKLFQYFSGNGSAEDRSEIRRWVESDEANRAEYMAQRKFYDIAMMLGADANEARNADNAGGAGTVAGQSTRRHTLRVWGGYIAAAVIGALLVVGGMRMFIDNADTALPMQTITVPAGQRLNIVLADGTSVWLNSNTTMRFPGAFTGDDRRVAVDGEAYFTVAKDARHPFKVDTKCGQIRVTGTTFNVDAYRNSDEFAVSLIEGSVTFHSPRGNYRLTPGTGIAAGDGGKMEVLNLEYDQFQWINGIVSFHDLPLCDILAKFEKYYGVSVDFKRDDIAQVRFSGKFYLDEGVEQALNTLRHDIDFNFTSDKDHRRITIN